MILIIDNYDSFVHNLARYFERAGKETKIVRNDAITIDEISALRPEAIVLSPGPCTPREAGICIETVKKLGNKIPILGVCLGHQAIGVAYGLPTVQSHPVHGKSCTIEHDKKGLFKGLNSPLQGGRYHSLIISDPNDKNDLFVTATCEDGATMAVIHKTNPVYGLQFHPESVLTPCGMEIIQNFCRIADKWNARKNAA